ncbi:MAG: lysophospholipid acyltransferase family protein [Deltaproteobacteria bacterium]|nr:lysophospholipid acyltransferase family protein [Deltaproteobacteria bacterium]
MAVSAKPIGSKLGYRMLGWCYRVFGYRFVAFWAVFIVFYYFLFSPRVVASSMRFYAALHPEAGRFARWRLAWRQFRSFSTVFMDRFLIENGQAEKFELTHDGLDTLVGAVQERRPLVLWMSHVGNWEVAVHCLKRFDVPITLVVARLVDERIEALQKAMLAQRRIKVVLVEEGAELGVVEVIKALRDGELVAVSGDRMYSEQQRSVEVELFGKKCPVPSGPYVLAGLTGAPIVPIFGFRTGRLAYRFVALEPQQVSLGKRSEREESIRRQAQACFDRLDPMIRSYPEQWYNFFDYWEP